jgi:hypothetical protein
MPEIEVDQEVLDWNHELSGDGIQEIVLTLAENLEIENQAMRGRDAALLEAVDHGDRLEAMRARLEAAGTSGTIVVDHYRIDTVRVVLLVPFGRQDGLSLGMESRGTVTRVLSAADGTETTTTEQFATTFVMRRATGARWLTVAERQLDG